MSVYEFWSRSELLTAFRDAQKKWMESLQAAASTSTENESRHIAEYTKQVEDIKEALRTIASKASQTSPRIFNVDYKHVQISNSIISTMKEVKKLQPGAQV